MSVVTSVFADYTFNPAVQQVKNWTLVREGTDQPKLHQSTLCATIFMVAYAAARMITKTINFLLVLTKDSSIIQPQISRLPQPSPRQQ